MLWFKQNPVRFVWVWLLLAGFALAACRLITPEEAVVVPTPLLAATAVAPTLPPTTSPTAPATAVAATNTPAPTPTLASTATSAPTAVATTNPPIEEIGLRALPTLSQGVLFIADGSLKLWGQNSRQIDTLLTSAAVTSQIPRESWHLPLVGDITDYVVSADGRRLVAARLTQGQPGDDPSAYRYELIWLDLAGGTSKTVAQDLSGQIDFALSDNGRYLAYTTLQPGTPNEERYAVILLESEAAGLPRTLANCLYPCSGLLWHPDNTNVVWSDPQALWLFNLASREPQKLLTNTVGDPAQTVVHSPVAWAKNGRFLLLWQGAYEGGSRVVFDAPTSQVLPIPDSFVYAEPFASEVVWMDDSRLFVTRPSLGQNGPGQPRLEIWRVQPETGSLVREADSTLSVDPSFATDPIHLPDGRFGFALVNPNGGAVNGLYILKGLGDTLTRINALPPSLAGYELEIGWALDAAGVFIAKDDGRSFYAPTGGQALYAIQAAIGGWAHHIHWLPRRTLQS